MWTKRDSAEDMINTVLPLNFRSFLKRNHTNYLNSMFVEPILDKKCVILIDNGCFVIGKMCKIEGLGFPTKWRINTTEKDWEKYIELSGREDLRDRFKDGYDCWRSFNVKAALGWIYPEEIFTLIKKAKFRII